MGLAWFPSQLWPCPALPAGNCVVLKPSEISKSTEKILVEVLPQYLDRVSTTGGPPGGAGPSSHFLWVEGPWPGHHPSQPQCPS